MSIAKELTEELTNFIATLEVEARYMRERNERLESENEYLKKQVDVLLKVIGKESHGN